MLYEWSVCVLVVLEKSAGGLGEQKSKKLLTGAALPGGLFVRLAAKSARRTATHVCELVEGEKRKESRSTRDEKRITRRRRAINAKKGEDGRSREMR